MGTITAIQGVDDTLKKLATDAVAGLSPKPAITVGPLDRDADDLRLNWFLYRVGPNPAYRNMEPPRKGWRTRHGNPPLALQLSYLLTAFPASATNGGDQEQFAHAALAATMQALHENAIVTESDAVLSPLAAPLVEPLRITLESLDLEAITKIWTAATKPIRLSVGYEVGLVVVDATEEFAPGPPVRVRRVAVAPSIGPRLVSADPDRITHGVRTTVRVEGLTAGTTFVLPRETGDPVSPDDWAMTVVTNPAPPPGTVVLELPRDDLVPGARRLDAVTTVNGLPAGRDSIGVTVVPVVTGPSAPVPKNVATLLDTAHAAPDAEVFVGGVALDAGAVAFVSPTQLSVTIPLATASGPTDVVLRAAKVTGPPATLVIA